MFEHIVPCGIRDRGVTSMAQRPRRARPRCATVVDRVVDAVRRGVRHADGRSPGRRVAQSPDDLAPFTRGAADRRAGAPARPAGGRGRRVDGRSRGAAPGVDEGPRPLRRRVPRAEAARARPRPAHGVRGGRLPEHLRVLGRSHGHVHDPRRPLHAGVRVLPGRHPQAARRSTLDEPRRVADAVRALGLAHVVITCVARDDLPDGGASVFAATVDAIRAASPGTAVELLISDCKGDAGVARRRSSRRAPTC